MTGRSASVPVALRVALYNAMGGWGPYSVREIEDLFRTYGFEARTDDIDDVSGVRRETVENFQQAIDWSDSDQRRRYLMLVEDVLENFPDQDGKPHPQGKAIRRALALYSGVQSTKRSTDEAARVDLWRPSAAPRVFLSHLAKDREEVHELARVLKMIGFACFVAHDEIRPSRSWLREIERALNSCEILVGYITEGFSESEWTDQEVGWALGRGLVAIPVVAGGPMPYGFLGTYQAIKRGPDDHIGLGRRVFASIVDATFDGQRPYAEAIVPKVAPLVTNAFSRSTSAGKAAEHFELLRQIPASAWTLPMREQIETALRENPHVRKAMLPADEGLVADATTRLLASL